MIIALSLGGRLSFNPLVDELTAVVMEQVQARSSKASS